MKYTAVLGKTLREVPQSIRTPSHALLHRAGFVRRMAQGLYSFLPLGMRVLQNIQRIIAEEMRSLGGQEIYVPVVTPSEIWRHSGRFSWISELASFRDRHGKELVISPTHEEAFVELVRETLSSYRELPQFLYQFQIKFRDEERPKDGLVRTKEIYMHDAYSFHRSYQDLNNFFPKTFSAYKRVFDRCGIQTFAGEGGVGYIGGEKSYEFLMPTDSADHAIILCDKCRYCASKEVAVGGKKYFREEEKALETVHTPGCTTIDELSEFLGVPKERTAKSLVYDTPQGLVMAIVRGDYDLGLEKLSTYLKYPAYRQAGDEELAAAGLVPGYLSPIGADRQIRVVVDDAVARSNNLVYGANRPEYHLLNGNFGRDFSSQDVADIALTRDEKICLQCGGTLREIQALEVGHIFKLGDTYTRTMNLSYQDERGAAAYPHMGCYGVGLGRLMDAVVRTNHDDRGILWPVSLAPFQVHLMSVGKSLSVKRAAEELHHELGDRALYDDRGDSPGVKFTDADLIGIPLRIVVGAARLAEGKVEIKER
ncbi:MAG: proline--tRNA ligase, partial [Spirochaetales bacterium]|nr:proline--tRNA ligase [Spirochaetales bacterium]